MQIKILVLLSALLITACQPIDGQTNAPSSAMQQEKRGSVATEESRQAPVYVTALNVSSNEGDAAATKGVLNVQHGCLYLDDRLLVVNSAYIRWTQEPFMIKDGDKPALSIGERALVGGSSATYQSMRSFTQPWQQPPKPECVAERVWLMNSVEALLD